MSDHLVCRPGKDCAAPEFAHLVADKLALEQEAGEYGANGQGQQRDHHHPWAFVRLCVAVVMMTVVLRDRLRMGFNLR